MRIRPSALQDPFSLRASLFVQTAIVPAERGRDLEHRSPDMSNFLRRLPLSRLLLLCATVLAVGIGATALAVALGTGPVPPPKPLAQAVHDALAAPSVDGVSARIQLTDHLLEGANLASQPGAGGGEAAASPLLTGASGRLWISGDGRVRLELQAEQGDTQILYDGHTISLYDAATNSLYRYTPPARQQSASASGGELGVAEPEIVRTKTGSSSSSSSSEPAATTDDHGIPTVAEIQEAIVHVMRHANLSGATPTDVAGQPAYAVRISPSHDGGLVGSAELAWDADHGVPLRLAVYSTQSSSPVLELTATEVSYGAVSSSVFEFTPPANAKVTEIEPPGAHTHARGGASEHTITHEQGLAAVQAAVPFAIDAPATLAGMTRNEVRGAQVNGHAAALITYGEGLGGIALLESATKSGGETAKQPAEAGGFLGELPKVTLPGASASELPTPLGTLLSFQRTGVAYVLAGSVTPTTLQEAAKGL
jgi:outer membrane lipoprotein-sorting protein